MAYYQVLLLLHTYHADGLHGACSQAEILCPAIGMWMSDKGAAMQKAAISP